MLVVAAVPLVELLANIQKLYVRGRLGATGFSAGPSFLRRSNAIGYLAI